MENLRFDNFETRNQINHSPSTKNQLQKYRFPLRPSILGEEHDFGYVDTSQMKARLATSDCQDFNSRIKKNFRTNLLSKSDIFHWDNDGTIQFSNFWETWVRISESSNFNCISGNFVHQDSDFDAKSRITFFNAVIHQRQKVLV